MSVAFANNPTGSTLGGTLSVTASQGVASFNKLTINKTGSGYTLRVVRSGLTSATSNPINVTKNGMTSALAIIPHLGASPASTIAGSRNVVSTSLVRPVTGRGQLPVRVSQARTGARDLRLLATELVRSGTRRNRTSTWS